MKTVLITGANGGLGKSLATKFASKKYRVLMACRNRQKGLQAREDVIRKSKNNDVEIFTLDLASMDSILSLKENIPQNTSQKKMQYFPIDILINNAGILTSSRQYTADGYPLLTGVNFLGTAVFTLTMLPFLSEDAKIFNINSLMYHFGNIHADFFSKKNSNYFLFKNMRDYADSKLGNLLFVSALANEFQKQNKNIVVNAIDPGVINTNMITMHAWFDVFADKLFRPFIRSPQQVAEKIFETCTHVKKENGLLLKNNNIVSLPKKILQYREEQKLLLRLQNFL